ncbi:MAG TPA: trypsin-like peptidase domain-containing protein [Hyphomicrobiaceae bacterium]|nr:trypsin-like peptidase domain-containing protein [Hyphomicrobiaceae bacterium]
MKKTDGRLAKRSRLTCLNRAAVTLIALVALGTSGAAAADGPRSASGLSARETSIISAGRDIAELVKRVKPTVVSVLASSGSGPGSDRSESHSRRLSLERQYRELLIPEHRLPVPEAQGAGFFVSPEGHVLTSYHVVEGATRIEVVTDAGERLDAHIVGSDGLTDLALLKVASPGPVVPATFAKAQPDIGEWVVAVGNPFGLGGSVSLGVVSARGREIGGGILDGYLQIDAAVNRGNSGGPAFGANGDVVGVNTAIVTPSGGSVGVAFAVPSPTAANVVRELIAHGRIDRGWIGLSLQPLTQELASGLGGPHLKGALVAAVDPKGPAAKAGLNVGDVIESLDGEPLDGAREMVRRVIEARPGQRLDIVASRNGERFTTKVTTGRLDDGSGGERSATLLQKGQGKVHIEVSPAAEVHGENAGGVVVTAVEGSADVDLSIGDLILRVGAMAVTTSAEFEAASSAARQAGRSHLVLLVRRDDEQRYIAVPVGADDHAGRPAKPASGDVVDSISSRGSAGGRGGNAGAGGPTP